MLFDVVWCYLIQRIVAIWGCEVDDQLYYHRSTQCNRIHIVSSDYQLKINLAVVGHQLDSVAGESSTKAFWNVSSNIDGLISMPEDEAAGGLLSF